MRPFYFCCVCFILADISVRTKAQEIIWITSNSVDASSPGFCNFVEEIEARSSDEIGIYFRIVSQYPDGGFDVHWNDNLWRYELRCNESLIVQEQYVVVVRAIKKSGTGLIGSAARIINLTFTGLSLAVDECADGTDNCHDNATCTDTDDSFTCTCNIGYAGTGTSCADVNECTDRSVTCDSNANCANTEGSFTCTCKDGFTGDGTSCADKDECIDGTNDCDTNANCTNTAGSFTCTCSSDYVGSGVSCTKVVTSCACSTSIASLVGVAIGSVAATLIVIGVVHVVTKCIRMQNGKKKERDAGVSMSHDAVDTYHVYINEEQHTANNVEHAAPAEYEVLQESAKEPNTYSELHTEQ